MLLSLKPMDEMGLCFLPAGAFQTAVQADWQGPNAAQKHGGSPEGLTPPHSRTIGTGGYKGNTYEGLAICRDLEENFAKAVARRLRPNANYGPAAGLHSELSLRRQLGPA